ncbi:hypothetical protein DPMN_034756 [Dreissena polymorpha]|uniref:Uncharacterized protein n=1 Tax=Dreissena polymorpha TaxID=45954 RepID=A0A9D4M7F1_DREPO|nr:hypothetical protein DPMN_034756 [Dreissena polymorpha]
MSKKRPSGTDDHRTVIFKRLSKNPINFNCTIGSGVVPDLYPTFGTSASTPHLKNATQPAE